MILIFPWEPGFDLNKIRMTMAPIWVDLLTLHPIFEDSALQLLGKVGKVVYVVPKYAHNKFANVCGYVKVNLSKPLKDYVGVMVEGIGDFKIDVAFQTLRDACFFCRKRGHLIQDCEALKQQEREELVREEEESVTFQEVKRKRQLVP